MDVKEAALRIEDEGYCILEDQLDLETIDRLIALAKPVLDQPERQRSDDEKGYLALVNPLSEFPEIIAPLVVHPPVLEIVEALLGKDFIATGSSMTLSKPGTAAGFLHPDWPLRFGPTNMPEPWPKSPSLLQVFWLISDFTATNGATRVVPFSHHTGRSPRKDREYPQEIPVVAKKGSVLMFHNGLWHQPGANTSTDEERIAVNIGYIPWYINYPTDEPWCTREVYDKFPARAQEFFKRFLIP